MTLNQRAVFTLGVGYGQASMARLGLWPDLVQPAPRPASSPSGGVGGRLRRRRSDDDEVLVMMFGRR